LINSSQYVSLNVNDYHLGFCSCQINYEYKISGVKHVIFFWSKRSSGTDYRNNQKTFYHIH